MQVKVAAGISDQQTSVQKFRFVYKNGRALSKQGPEQAKAIVHQTSSDDKSPSPINESSSYDDSCAGVFCVYA